MARSKQHAPVQTMTAIAAEKATRPLCVTCFYMKATLMLISLDTCRETYSDGNTHRILILSTLERQV